jgi:opacity protein-like surface antigen
MKNKLALIALSGLLISVAETGVADTENKFYAGLQYGVGEYSESNVSEDFDTSVAMGRFGYDINSSFSIEGRLGTSLEDDSQFLLEQCACGSDVTLEIDAIMGIYGKGRYDLSEWFSVYGMLGASRVEATVSLADFPDADNTESESTISYGVGVDIGFARRWAFNVEYLRYLDGDDFDLDIASAGVTFAF